MTARGVYDLSEDYESVFEEYSKEGDARYWIHVTVTYILMLDVTQSVYLV